MAINPAPRPAELPIKIARGQDATFELLIYQKWSQSEYVSVRAMQPAAALAITITIERLKYALSGGDFLDFGGMIVTVNGSHAVGATVLNVTALPGPIDVGDLGFKVQDLTGFTIETRILEPEAAASDLTLSGTVLDQTVIATRGRVQFTCSVAQSLARAAKRYFANAWRTNAGTTRPEWVGDIMFYDA